MAYECNRWIEQAAGNVWDIFFTKCPKRPSFGRVLFWRSFRGLLQLPTLCSSQRFCLSTPVKVTFDQVTCPRRGSFSSDGKQIVFDGVPSSNTTRERDDHELARWGLSFYLRPSSTAFSLHICDERRREIFILDLDSSALRQVTHLEERSTQARFVPYSRDIIFTHTDGTLVEDLSTSAKQLYLTDQSGGTARQVGPSHAYISRAPHFRLPTKEQIRTLSSTTSGPSCTGRRPPETRRPSSGPTPYLPCTRQTGTPSW